MEMQTLGGKPQQLKKLIRSTETTITIKKGAPVVLSLAAGSEGYGAKSIEGLAAAEQGFFFGIAASDIAPGRYGKTIFGYVAEARMIVRSRAASSDVWASSAALSKGAVLALMTLAGVQALSQSAAGSALTNPHVIKAVDTIASSDTQASSVTIGAAGTALIYSTALKKVFVSIM
jgi:hypothetical protein